MDQLLTTSEVAAKTGVPERTFDQWSYRGCGPAFVKIGRHRRYRETDVEAWLIANRRNAGDAA